MVLKVKTAAAQQKRLERQRAATLTAEGLARIMARPDVAKQRQRVRAFPRAPPPPPRTKWTRRVPHPVLIGHAASLTPY